jgi:chromosomal replication initiator protein
MMQDVRALDSAIWPEPSPCSSGRVAGAPIGGEAAGRPLAVAGEEAESVALSQAERTWNQLLPRLRALFGSDDFKAWIAPVSVVGADPKSVTLGVANPFALSRLRTDYLHRVQSVWSSVDPVARTLNVVVRRAGAAPAAPERARPRVEAVEVRTHEADRAADLVDAAPTPMKAVARTFEGFIAGASNRVALALAKGVAAGDAHHGEIILFHGPHGVGKTHLLESIAHAVGQANAAPGASERRVVLLTAQQFLNAFQSALRDRDTSAFKAALRAADLFLIDDLQFLDGKTVTQDEFFQTVGELLGRGRTVVCTADVESGSLMGLSPRMRDILNGGFNVRVDEPDFDLRVGIARAKAAELARTRPDFTVPEAAFDMIAAKVVETGRAVEGMIKKIFAASALIGREATMDVVSETLSGQIRPVDRPIPVDVIKRRVAAHFDLTLDDLCSQRRHRAVARPRQVAMYFCKKMTRRSFPDIGARFGGRDHTTVIHAVRKIEELSAADPAFAAELQRIAGKIVG